MSPRGFRPVYIRASAARCVSLSGPDDKNYHSGLTRLGRMLRRLGWLGRRYRTGEDKVQGVRWRPPAEVVH